MSGSFESMQWNACVQTSSSERGLGGVGGESESLLTAREISPLPKKGLNPQCCIKQDSKPKTLPKSYSSSHSLCNSRMFVILEIFNID